MVSWNFCKILWGWVFGVTVNFSVCLDFVPFDKNGDYRRGIVFGVEWPSRLYRAWWGVGGVDREPFLPCECFGATPHSTIELAVRGT